MKKIFLLLPLSILSFALVSCDGGDTEDVGEDFSLAVPPPAAASSGVIPAVPAADDDINLASQLEAAVFRQINAHRVSAGLPALALDLDITALALGHNEFMADEAFNSDSSSLQISHDNFNDRADVIFTNGYNSVGENVAANRGFAVSQVAAQFVTGWINSPGHLANIVGDYTHTGISVFFDERNNTYYATQLFAHQP